jgi:hypothetical protein
MSVRIESWIFLCKVCGSAARVLVHNMQHSLRCVLGVFMAVVADGFMTSFFWDDGAVFPVLPNSSRRFVLPPIAMYPDGVGDSAEPPPPPTTWSRLNNAPVLSRITRNEISTRRVENILVDFFSTLMYADDCTLLERQTQGMGAVYLDGNFSSSRRPLLLRMGVREIMAKYNMELHPVERKWTRCNPAEDTTDMDS